MSSENSSKTNPPVTKSVKNKMIVNRTVKHHGSALSKPQMQVDLVIENSSDSDSSDRITQTNK